MDLPEELRALLEPARDDDRPILALTGAGISAESGIPTFRGADGYWTVGSKNYRAEELATFTAFRQMPEAVWSWYLYRRSACLAADPNPAHQALADLEHQLGDRWRLATQNVDGLHLRAGSTIVRTHQIHGNLDFTRCADGCSGELRPFPAGIDRAWRRGRQVTADEAAQLRCDDCGGWLRPHVLWFDECYDEVHYRFDSTMRAANDAGLLLVIGTSGATNLPAQICALVHQRGAPMVVVNQDPSPFSAMADGSDSGHFVQGGAVEWIPKITDFLIGR